MQSQQYFPLQLNQENMTYKDTLQLYNRPLKSLYTDDILKAKTKQYYLDRNINGENITREQIKHEPDRIGRYYDMKLNIRNPLFNDFRYQNQLQKTNSMQNMINQSQNSLPKDYLLYIPANRDNYTYQPKKKDLLSAYDEQSLQNRYQNHFIGEKQVIFPQIPALSSEKNYKDSFQNAGQQIVNDQVSTQLKQYTVNLDPVKESNIFKNTQELYKPYTNRQGSDSRKQSINQNIEFQSQQVRQDFENGTKNQNAAQYNPINNQNQKKSSSQKKETPRVSLNYRPQFLDSSDIIKIQTQEQQNDYNQQPLINNQQQDQVNTIKSRGNIIQQSSRGNIIQKSFENNQAQNEQNQFQQNQLQKLLHTEGSHIPLTSSKLFKPFNPITNKQHFEYEPKYDLPGVKLDSYQRDQFSEFKDKQKTHQNITRDKNIQLHHLEDDFVTTNKQYGNIK